MDAAGVATGCATSRRFICHLCRCRSLKHDPQRALRIGCGFDSGRDRRNADVDAHAACVAHGLIAPCTLRQNSGVGAAGGACGTFTKGTIDRRIAAGGQVAEQGIAAAGDLPAAGAVGIAGGFGVDFEAAVGRDAGASRAEGIFTTTVTVSVLVARATLTATNKARVCGQAGPRAAHAGALCRRPGGTATGFRAPTAFNPGCQPFAALSDRRLGRADGIFGRYTGSTLANRHFAAANAIEVACARSAFAAQYGAGVGGKAGPGTVGAVAAIGWVRGATAGLGAPGTVGGFGELAARVAGARLDGRAFHLFDGRAQVSGAAIFGADPDVIFGIARARRRCACSVGRENAGQTLGATFVRTAARAWLGTFTGHYVGAGSGIFCHIGPFDVGLNLGVLFNIRLFDVGLAIGGGVGHFGVGT